MHLSGFDLQYVAKELEQQLNAGNLWAVVSSGIFLTQFEDARYFKTEDEAKGFHSPNISDKDFFKPVAIQPLYNCLQQLYKVDVKRNDIDYYVINDNDFKVSRVLKNNPDQNPLHDPDGNEFTYEVIAHFEKSDKAVENEINKVHGKPDNGYTGNQSNSYDNQPLPYENIKQLQEELLALGYEADCVMAIEDPIKDGVPQFEVAYNQRDFNEMMTLVLRFSRHENGLYGFDGVKATLFYKIEVEPIVINGINIMDLEAAMRFQDWDVEKYRWGKVIEDSFQLISLDEDGKRIAVALWNNEFPPDHVEKPDLILALESELTMFPVREFSNKREVEEIYSDLQDIQNIGDELSKLPIDLEYYSRAKSVIIERLINGEQHPLRVRTNTSNQQEVFLQLKAPYSTKVKLVDKEGNEYRPVQGKVFEKGSIEEVKIEPPSFNELLPKNRESTKGLGPMKH